MKKIKAKLQTTSLIAFATVLLIVSAVQIAEAEPMRTISGYDANSEIFIADDGINNIIILYSDTGISKHFDSKVRTYNSGGFSMRSPEILVFAHPISDELYKLVVFTTDKVYRFIGISGIIQDLDEKPIPSEEEEKIESGIVEPKSSIGADITRWDIPNTLSRAGESSSFLMALQPAKTYKTLQLGDKFEFNGYVYSVRDSATIKDADVFLEISRDNYILKSVETKSGTGGTIRVEIDDMIYPLFYPNFCYDVKVTANHGNYTTVWTDDFVMVHSGVWNPDMSWLNLDRWNYLPNDFRSDPRVSINADERCN